MIFAVTAFCMVVGLFWGFSGQLGTLVGLVAGLAAGYFLFVPIRGLTVATGWLGGEAAQNGAAAIADFVVALVVFGLSRKIVAKCVSFLVPQPLNAIAGSLIGFVKGMLFVSLLTGAGLVQTGRFSEGFFAAHSTFVKMAGSIADSYMQGAAR